ncbi:Uncharacterised protein [Mycobacterium tuberculosis]|nr:Uncharacterised protein [Mycobacterium tuberculosis]
MALSRAVRRCAFASFFVTPSGVFRVKYSEPAAYQALSILRQLPLVMKSEKGFSPMRVSARA